MRVSQVEGVRLEGWRDGTVARVMLLRGLISVVERLEKRY